MGHCFSCFNNQPTAEPDSVSTPVASKKDEMTEVFTEVMSTTPSAYAPPASLPLLDSIHPHMNGNRSHPINYYTQSQNNRVPVDAHIATDKNTKSFYQKLPSIKSVSTIGSSDSKFSETRINQLFEQYKDEDNAILSDGIEKLCGDLQLNPDEFKVLVLAWKLNAAQMCCFTKMEFVQGLKSIRADSTKTLQTRLTEIASELPRDTELFKDLYRFTFRFGLDVATGQRILPSEVGVLLWRLVFTPCEPPILSRWLGYLEKNPHIRGIPKDTWYMFLNFCESVGTDLSSYDDTEAWPSLFDDFVEYENDQMNQNISKSDIKKEDN